LKVKNERVFLGYGVGMSYDLMVFEPEAAPRKHAALMAWYDKLTKWDEGHSYGDSAVTTPRLRAWLGDMQKIFPSIYTPETEDALDGDGVLSDYSIAKQAIYAGFAWSKAVDAAATAERLAAKHGVGFFDVSSGGEEVWLPSDDKLVLVHKKSTGLAGKLKGMFGG
jgi:hypothetical protein